jgi:hypothetical protein
MDAVTQRYSYRPEHIIPEHSRRFTDDDFRLIAPLLESQSYIQNVCATNDSNMRVDYDLDSFRSVLWRSFVGNYNEAYFKTFSVPYTEFDIVKPWLSIEPKFVAPMIVSRTFRYRNPGSEKVWRSFTSMSNFSNNAVFIGLPEEHADFEQTFAVKVSHYKTTDFLHIAQALSGADHIISNQTSIYALAQGLGKETSLECIPDRTLQLNECYFPRKGNFYF